jgi:DNA modification methylase
MVQENKPMKNNLSNIEDLKDSIEKVGLLQPLIIDKKRRVISGNRRFQSVKELKWKSVEVIISDIKEKDVPLYIVSYNKQRIKTIKEQLLEIKVLQKYYSKGKGFRSDLTSAKLGKGSSRNQISQETGISSGQIQKILFIDSHNSTFVDLIDKGIMTVNQAYLECNRKKTEQISIQPTSTRSIKFDKENIKLYNKSSDNLSEIKDSQIQLIFTSPPYWNKRLYHKNKGLGNEKTPEDYVENLSEHFTECHRVLNNKGSFFLNIGDTYLDGNLLNIPHRIAIKLQEKGWILRNTIIWKKTNPKPSSSKTNLTSTYEFIFHFVKSLEYYYNPTKVPLSSNTKPSHPPRHRNITENKIAKYSPYIPSQDGKNMGDYWNEDIVMTAVANQKTSNVDIEHPAPFPKELVILPLLQTTKLNDWVLDPFCGSGTTGKVSVNHGRKFIGYDIQKSFIQSIIKSI